MYQFEALAAVPSAEASVAGAVVGGVVAGGATGSVVELAEPGVSVVDVCALSPACVDDGVPAPPPVVGDALAAGTVTVTVRSWTTMCSWMTGCATTRSVITRGSGSGLTSAEMLRPTATRPRAAGAQRATNPGRWTECVSGSGGVAAPLCSVVAVSSCLGVAAFTPSGSLRRASQCLPASIPWVRPCDAKLYTVAATAAPTSVPARPERVRT